MQGIGIFKYIYYFYICTYLVTLYTRWDFMFLVSEKYRWFGDAVFSRFFKVIADFVTLFLTSLTIHTTDVRHVQHSTSTIIPLIVSLITIPIALWTQISCRFLFCTPRNGCCSDYCHINTSVTFWFLTFSCGITNHHPIEPTSSWGLLVLLPGNHYLKEVPQSLQKHHRRHQAIINFLSPCSG